MDELLLQQRLAMRTVNRALENFKKLGRANHTYGIVRNRLQTLKENYAKCELLHSQILKVATTEQKDNEKYFKDDVFGEMEGVYIAASDYIADALAALESSSTPSSPGLSVSHTTLHDRVSALLPRINLPKFSGALSEWETFRDQFKSIVIDNVELSNVTRLHYLHSCLKGEAREALRTLPLTEANFQIAWDILLERYNDKRRLVTEHLHTLLTLPVVSNDSAQELSLLRDKVSMTVQSLKNLGRPVKWWDDMLVHLVVQKLNKSTRKAWELHLGEKTEYPSYQDLHHFLASRIRAFEHIPIATTTKTKPPSKSSVQSHTVNATVTHCPLCKQDHFLSRCPDFQKKTISQRRELVIKFRRCLNCLSARHSKATCPSKHHCRQCQQRHHTMLHEATMMNNTENSPESSEASTSNDTNVASHLIPKTTLNKSRILLATARIQVHSSSGRRDVVRALLDQGSVTSLISENLAQRLRLPRKRVSVTITGIGGAESLARHAAAISVSSRDGEGPSYSTNAIVLRSLTKYIPPTMLCEDSFSHLSGLPWADPQISNADPIEMILGADLYSSILLPGLRPGYAEKPTAQNTIFGWIISGPISTNSSASVGHVSIHHTSLHASLDDEIRRFWEVEELPQLSLLTPEEQRCEDHFRATHSRTANGQYIIRLPFKTKTPIQIGESRHIALSLLSSSESRLKGKPSMAVEYREFLQEYENLGHMEKVEAPSSSPASSTQVVYIPHHAVIREHSSTTRLRVVFNASQSTSNGSSLNDHLMIGPKLQTDLRSVILRWRQHRYVYTADIAKMYRQIKVDPRDQDYQRILWRSSSSDPVQEYRLLTVTYGTACAPYLALRTIQQLLQDEGDQYPLAQSVLRNQVYVDDCIFGADDKPLAKQIRDQLIALLNKGGFPLRKWASNCPTLLDDFPLTQKSRDHSKILQSEESFKVLGVTWLPATDAFKFSVELVSSAPKTKRTILSTIARLFDPLGWLAPVVITAKIIMQQLWATKCLWDEPIPPPLMQKWQNYYQQLPHLRSVSMKRWTEVGPDALQCELHGFADASSVAYAAVVYLKVISLSGSVSVSLLIAKSKVAPLKILTIPRLELSAAVLLARTMSFVKRTLEPSLISCHCWTDSTVALAWLRQSPSRWKTFVAHRVHDVQTQLPDAIWHHVPTHQNPADLASRGIPASSFKDSSMWWRGPEWLKLPSSQWPDENRQQEFETLLEERSRAAVHVIVGEASWDLASRYSSWPKLIRVTAYLMRFVNRLRDRVNNRRRPDNENDIPPDVVSVDEYQSARVFWLRVIQTDLFRDDISRLQSSNAVAKTSKLIALNPFMDKTHLIRVGGRLRRSELSYNAKYPVVPAAHPLVTLIIEHAHTRSLHAGCQLTLHVLREDFWILRARQTVRAVLHRCVPCTREKAAVPQELMGDLPTMRIRQVDRAFIHCGLDYAGPVPIRLKSGRGHKSQKAYMAVFVCMTTRAIHLDVVSDYTTEAFIAAYVRFCSRRGRPTDLYSDNAKNFRGADRELRAAVKAAQNNSTFRSKLSCEGVRWHFIPPSAPHFGGLWEAGVRSVKYHLKRVIGANTLTFEELTTLLCQVEACLNSRPIAPMSDSLDDYTCLTPGHFLIGHAITAVPAPTLLETKESRLTRWQLIRQKSELIWKAWSNDYLHGLQQRPKWRVAQNLARVGRVVLLRNPLAPPCKWELGRITECHAGDDGLTRVVTVRTATSSYKRSIVKLCFLPVDLNEASASIPASTP